MMDVGNEGLVAAWAELVGVGAGVRNGEGGAVARAEHGAELIAAYGEVHRRYHTVDHLEHLLRAIELLGDEATDLRAVRYAAWFHDAVYEINSGSELSNEERSAQLAERVLVALGESAELVADVGRLVRLTAGHDPAPGDANGAVLCDADLAILGASADDYARYSEQIRDEYREIPDELFRPGRAAVLRALLDHDTIYWTQAGRDLFENAARRNVGAEIEQLTLTGE